MPVRHGHFLFVAWDVPATSWDAPTEELPTLIGFK
jgi:hypothetical protein